METYNCTNNYIHYEYITAENIDSIPNWKDFTSFQVLEPKHDIKDIQQINDGVFFTLHDKQYCWVLNKNFNDIVAVTKLKSGKTFYQYTLNFDTGAKKLIKDYLISKTQPF